MEKKVAIVTGGVAGIGKAISLALVDEGYLVATCDVNEERGKSLQREFPGAIVFKPCNVADENDVRTVVTDVCEEYGRTDALVNNVSEGTDFITGEIIDINGGFLMD